MWCCVLSWFSVWFYYQLVLRAHCQMASVFDLSTSLIRLKNRWTYYVIAKWKMLVKTFYRQTWLTKEIEKLLGINVHVGMVTILMQYTIWYWIILSWWSSQSKREIGIFVSKGPHPQLPSNWQDIYFGMCIFICTLKIWFQFVKYSDGNIWYHVM